MFSLAIATKTKTPCALITRKMRFLDTLKNCIEMLVLDHKKKEVLAPQSRAHGHVIALHLLHFHQSAWLIFVGLLGLKSHNYWEMK